MQAASAKPPPLGLCDYPSSRAVYAIDLMLKWDRRPDGKGREGGKHCRAGQGRGCPGPSPPHTPMPTCPLCLQGVA